MVNTYVRLLVLAVVVLGALGIVAFIIPLLIKAAIIAAVALGALFLINLFRRGRCAAVRTRDQGTYLG